jgi:ankyrin repeat protein
VDNLAKLIEEVQRGDLDSVRTILEADHSLVHQKDNSGASALHYAAINSNRAVVLLLLERGADINSTDLQFGATPAGWAIEYLREKGGYLAIELNDLAYAIQLGDERWVARFLKRFPALRQARDIKGIPFKDLAKASGNPEIVRLFENGA